MPPGSRQAMPMIATGVRGVLIIGAKDIADPESARYVLARTKPSPSQQRWSCVVSYLNCWVAAVSTIDLWRIAVGGSGARCRGSDSCTSVTVSRSSDRSAAGFPVDCSSGPHRCGPTPMRGAGPTTRWLRHRSRSSPTEPRRDTAECSGPGDRRSAPRRIRANVSSWCRAGPTPDMQYRSTPSDCASRVVHHIRDTVSRVGRYELPPTSSRCRMEPPIGIEPMTSCLQDRCSTTELRRPAGPEFIGSLVCLDDPLRRHGPRR